MSAFRVIAISTEAARQVRATLRSPFHELPAQVEVARDDAPCRHCLRKFVVGVDRRILCIYDRFDGVEALPQPGPIYLHATDCERYAENGGFPLEMRESPRTLEAYAKGRNLLAWESVVECGHEAVIEKMFAHPEVDYIQVNSTTAGCFTFRIERVARENGTPAALLGAL